MPSRLNGGAGGVFEVRRHSRRNRMPRPLRADGVILTYDPQDRTLRAGGHGALSVIIGKDR